ncbi:hypothetical protein DPMN_091597 [Dreissena polymorpha]|uniref:Uncharacterized protein n=1 Tax=Dreissena polymorpha TaxID=45954 RepID=A0A9D4L049_DREPO|nr:hypothetical protein DPMN_091597 [Dreissena polymorpha]
MNGVKLEEVTNYKYMEATLSKDATTTAEVRISIAMATPGFGKATPSASTPSICSTSPA